MTTFLETAASLLTLCSLCIMPICNFSYFPFWFEGWDWGHDCYSSCSRFICCFQPRKCGAQSWGIMFADMNLIEKQNKK